MPTSNNGQPQTVGEVYPVGYMGAHLFRWRAFVAGLSLAPEVYFSTLAAAQCDLRSAYAAWRRKHGENS